MGTARATHSSETEGKVFTIMAQMAMKTCDAIKNREGVMSAFLEAFKKPPQIDNQFCLVLAAIHALYPKNSLDAEVMTGLNALRKAFPLEETVIEISKKIRGKKLLPKAKNDIVPSGWKVLDAEALVITARFQVKESSDEEIRTGEFAINNRKAKYSKGGISEVTPAAAVNHCTFFPRIVFPDDDDTDGMLGKFIVFLNQMVAPMITRYSATITQDSKLFFGRTFVFNRYKTCVNMQQLIFREIMARGIIKTRKIPLIKVDVLNGQEVISDLNRPFLVADDTWYNGIPNLKGVKGDGNVLLALSCAKKAAQRLKAIVGVTSGLEKEFKNFLDIYLHLTDVSEIDALANVIMPFVRLSQMSESMPSSFSLDSVQEIKEEPEMAAPPTDEEEEEESFEDQRDKIIAAYVRKGATVDERTSIAADYARLHDDAGQAYGPDDLNNYLEKSRKGKGKAAKQGAKQGAPAVEDGAGAAE